MARSAGSMVVILCAASAATAWAAGEFTDVAGELGVAVEASSDQGPGCGFADIDSDGDLDIYVVDGLGDPNRLFRQDGLRNFTEVSSSYGVGDTGWGKSATFADYDNDGDPDLLLTRLGGAITLYRNDGTTFVDVSASAGFAALGSAPYTGAAWADFDNDGWLDVYITRYTAAANRLMRNLGNGTFQDVATSAGVANATGYGFQPIWFDYDNDRDQDLYISNDIFGTPNALYRNEGNGSFTDVSAASGTGIDMSAMGIAVADFDNNGFLDFYVANIATGNVFLTNNGDGTFTERAAELGIEVGDVCWGVDFFDYDHDGWVDLYVNVASDQYIDEPPADDLQSRFVPSDGEGPDLAARGDAFENKLYRNIGGTSFADVSTGSGVENPGRSFCSAVADYDSDGDLDIYITNWYEFGFDLPTALFENNHVPRGGSSQDWLRVQLIGTISNRDGVGARVFLEGPTGWQMREKQIGTSYLGSSDPFLHFGTGGATVIPQVFVLWPSGLSEVYEDVPCGQVLLLVEGDGVPASAPEDVPPAVRGSAVRVFPNPTLGAASIRLRMAAEEGTVSIVDPRGRIVRSLRVTGVPGVEAALDWDGRDASGQELAAGRYFVVSSSGTERSAGSLTIVR